VRSRYHACVERFAARGRTGSGRARTGYRTRRGATAIVLAGGATAFALHTIACSDWNALSRCRDGACLRDAGGAAEGGVVDGGIGLCDAAGVDISFGATNQPVTRVLDFASAPKQTSFAEALSGGPCPMALDEGVRVPARAYLVQNATSSPGTLSAWAVCTDPTESAFLTFYARSTAPQTNVEIQACTGWVANGAQGRGGFDSPDEEGAWCPGLTKANDGGLPLGPCDVAVVYLQSASPDPDAAAPRSVRMVLEP